MTTLKLLEAEELQNGLVACATGGSFENAQYQELRIRLTSDSGIAHLVPRFVFTNRDLSQFWAFIKTKFGTYVERRQYLWSEFRPLLEYLEKPNAVPQEESIALVLKPGDLQTVHNAWQKALSRRNTDPGGAITAARALLETACKCILDDLKVSYKDDADLPKLYRQTAEALGLAPQAQLAPIINQIFGACFAVVEGIGALRNKVGDAHGKGINAIEVDPNLAEFAVNVSGSVTLFLVSAWNSARQRKRANPTQ